MDEDKLEQWIKKIIREGNIHAFYVSKEWKHLAKEVRKEQKECQRHKEKKSYAAASTVHHKKPIKQFPKLALTKSNLELLCDSCHREEHNKENKQKGFTNQEKW